MEERTTIRTRKETRNNSSRPLQTVFVERERRLA
jgi:hypothetical protein